MDPKPPIVFFVVKDEYVLEQMKEAPLWKWQGIHGRTYVRTLHGILRGELIGRDHDAQ